MISSSVATNLFAYCKNDPINNCDPYGLLQLPHDDKYVHDAVLEDICSRYPELRMHFTCIRYYEEGRQTGRWGFCDLYSSRTGEVWELKKNSTSKSCRTESAQAQLEKYISGSLLHNPDLPLQRPNTTLITGNTFTTSRGNWIYDVTYWNEGNGIIRYSYTKRFNVARAVVMTAVALTVVATAASGGLLAPVGGGAVVAMVA